MEKFEFWFRKEYEDVIHKKILTQFVRPGIRQFPEPKGTNKGDVVLVRILDKPGTDTSQPVLNSHVSDAVVEKLVVKKIMDMTAEDFEGASEDSSSKLGVVAQLERIYNKHFNEGDVVTVFKISYT